MDRRAQWATVHGVTKSQVCAHMHVCAHTRTHNDANTLPVLIFFKALVSLANIL